MYKTTLVIRNALGKLVLVSVFSKNSTIRSNRNIRLIRKSTGQGTISEHSVPNNKYAKSVKKKPKKFKKWLKQTLFQKLCSKQTCRKNADHVKINIFGL